MIRSTFFKIYDCTSIKSLNEDISPIQHYAVLGRGFEKGRKKKLDDSKDGHVAVTFSDYFIANLRSSELSKALNFTFMRKLSTALGRRYFRLIGMRKAKESNNKGDLDFIEKEIFEIGKLLPLFDYQYASTVKRHIDPVHCEKRPQFIKSR